MNSGGGGAGRRQHPRNFHDAKESHRSPIHGENRYLPPLRRDEGNSANVNGELSNLVRIVTPQRLFGNTHPVTQPRAYNEPLSFARAHGALFNHPLGTNREHQIP